MRLAAAGRFLLDALLPPHCGACDAAVASQGLLCAGCVGELTTLGDPLCARCGTPFRHAGQAESGMDGRLLCAACHARPPPYARVAAAFRYDEGVKRLILPFKHGDRPEMAQVLAARMLVAGGAILARAQRIVPVPLHPQRLRARRYNQAAILATRLARATGVRADLGLLRRIRATAPLGESGALARAAMLEGAIRIRPRADLAGLHVVVVDDVMTSGATLGACAEALLAAGAAEVSGLVAARVPHSAYWD